MSKRCLPQIKRFQNGPPIKRLKKTEGKVEKKHCFLLFFYLVFVVLGKAKWPGIFLF